MVRNQKLHKIIIYILVFLFTLHFTPAIYINSSFLGQFLKANQVGYIYTIASILTIIGFIAIRPILSKYGNYKTLLALVLVEFIALLTLAFYKDPLLLIAAFIVSFMVTSIAFFNIDIFLENVSTNKDTGSIRGVFLTSLNTAFIIGPLMTGLVLTNGDFWKVYLLGAILLLPVIYILVRYLGSFHDPKYKDIDFFKTAKKIYRNHDLYSIFSSGFILRFFYAWMIIYTPIFLHQHIGFSFSEVSFIIGIALIAFVLLEAPLGYLADKYVGEKEILTAGFIITALATTLMTFTTEKNFILWAVILFVTRVGASMIEVMTETYLFKKINSTNISIMGFFRIIRPFAYILAPTIASLLLLSIDLKYIFVVLGAIMLFGLRYSLTITDTK
ncbi:MAG: MFS family permease [Candidatus Paceibacteria bacterium]|jgi:MFS family permease